MADNIAITPGVGATVATDEVTIDGALAHVQRVKPVHGVAGAGVDVSASDPLPTEDAQAHTDLAAILAALADPATETTLAAVLAALPSDPATQTTAAALLVELQAINASTDTLEANTDGLETALGLLATESKLEAVRALIAGLPTASPLTDSQLRATAVPVSGTVTASGPLTDTQLRASAVSVDSSRPATATLTNVSSSASSVTLLSSASGRKGAYIFNDSTAILYVKLGTTASSTSYTVQIAAGGYYELPHPCYTGRIDGIWASANGNARVTELTA